VKNLYLLLLVLILTIFLNGCASSNEVVRGDSMLDCLAMTVEEFNAATAARLTNGHLAGAKLIHMGAMIPADVRKGLAVDSEGQPLNAKAYNGFQNIHILMEDKGLERFVTNLGVRGRISLESVENFDNCELERWLNEI